MDGSHLFDELVRRAYRCPPVSPAGRTVTSVHPWSRVATEGPSDAIKIALPTPQPNTSPLEYPHLLVGLHNAQCRAILQPPTHVSPIPLPPRRAQPAPHRHGGNEECEVLGTHMAIWARIVLIGTYASSRAESSAQYTAHPSCGPVLDSAVLPQPKHLPVPAQPPSAGRDDGHGGGNHLELHRDTIHYRAGRSASTRHSPTWKRRGDEDSASPLVAPPCADSSSPSPGRHRGDHLVRAALSSLMSAAVTRDATSEELATASYGRETDLVGSRDSETPSSASPQMATVTRTNSHGDPDLSMADHDGAATTQRRRPGCTPRRASLPIGPAAMEGVAQSEAGTPSSAARLSCLVSPIRAGSSCIEAGSGSGAAVGPPPHHRRDPIGIDESGALIYAPGDAEVVSACVCGSPDSLEKEELKDVDCVGEWKSMATDEAAASHDGAKIIPSLLVHTSTTTQIFESCAMRERVRSPTSAVLRRWPTSFDGARDRSYDATASVDLSEVASSFPSHPYDGPRAPSSSPPPPPDTSSSPSRSSASLRYYLSAAGSQAAGRPSWAPRKRAKGSRQAALSLSGSGEHTWNHARPSTAATGSYTRGSDLLAWRLSFSRSSSGLHSRPTSLTTTAAAATNSVGGDGDDDHVSAIGATEQLLNEGEEVVEAVASDQSLPSVLRCNEHSRLMGVQPEIQHKDVPAGATRACECVGVLASRSPSIAMCSLRDHIGAVAPGGVNTVEEGESEANALTLSHTAPQHPSWHLAEQQRARCEGYVSPPVVSEDDEPVPPNPAARLSAALLTAAPPHPYLLQRRHGPTPSAVASQNEEEEEGNDSTSGMAGTCSTLRTFGIAARSTSAAPTTHSESGASSPVAGRHAILLRCGSSASAAAATDAGGGGGLSSRGVSEPAPGTPQQPGHSQGAGNAQTRAASDVASSPLPCAAARSLTGEQIMTDLASRIMARCDRHEEAMGWSRHTADVEKMLSEEKHVEASAIESEEAIAQGLSITTTMLSGAAVTVQRNENSAATASSSHDREASRSKRGNSRAFPGPTSDIPPPSSLGSFAVQTFMEKN